MQRRLFLSLLSVLPLAVLSAAPGLAPAAPVKVACVGDSITAGSGVKDKSMTYPKQLAALLGDTYTVQNFGVSGATMLNAGDKPYQKEKRFADALAFVPDIVVIKLGTNDTKPHNWSKKEGFATDAKGLIAAFQKVNRKVQVYLCTPVPVFAQGNFGIRGDVVLNEIIPLDKQVASELKIPLIDLHTPFAGKDALVPDRVHPNDAGATIIAQTVFESLKSKK
ncbi:GDSL-type esterase/lipase family protein [Verrucomicrobium sp. BvORR034]|uniref:GDSL-type esterase/lipase family protein n=1 Tax=Verrucomicrobium sp. BvORR034 TaxID=1396418 RepID=UPI0006790ADD|nr:GDSL-type esterase/lipase family protein [Verrucomicrobium sp. BvORR034]